MCANSSCSMCCSQDLNTSLDHHAAIFSVRSIFETVVSVSSFAGIDHSRVGCLCGSHLEKTHRDGRNVEKKKRVFNHYKSEIPLHTLKTTRTSFCGLTNPHALTSSNKLEQPMLRASRHTSDHNTTDMPARPKRRETSCGHSPPATSLLLSVKL